MSISASVRTVRHLQTIVCCAVLSVPMGATACASDSTVLVGTDAVRVISVETSAVSLIEGDRMEVVIHVNPEGPAVTLSAEGLSTGLGASFAPEMLPPGVTRSVMTIVAGPPTEATVTIRATSNHGRSGATTQSTAKLGVSVTSCPGYAIPDRCPPFPTGGSLAITGVVRERTADGLRPLEGFSLWAWVQRPTNGYSAGHVKTGPGGAYTFPLLPESFVVLQAYGGGWDQPCGSFVQLPGNGRDMDIEVVSEARPIFDPAPEAPALTGVVYESGSPVAGARVYFEILLETITATTTTDEQGRYSLCRLPPNPAFVTPYKPGYAVVPKPVTVSGVTVMDLQLTR